MTSIDWKKGFREKVNKGLFDEIDYCDFKLLENFIESLLAKQRQDVLEEAAKVAESDNFKMILKYQDLPLHPNVVEIRKQARMEVAHTIRALGDKK